MNAITPNFHILTIKNLMATDANPSRVKIISDKFEQSIIIPYSNEPGSGTPALDSAVIWLKTKGHNVIGHGEGKHHYYVICDHVNGSFLPLKATN